MSAAVQDDRGWRGVAQQPERTLFDAAEEARTLAPATIEARFQAFHREHPEVYVKLVEFSVQLLDAGWDHFGISVPWERLRYETMLGASRAESPYKLNDNYRSRYARLIADQEPRLAEVFTLRQLRSASRPPSARRIAGECSACVAGHCRSCSDAGCPHECDVGAML